MAKKKRVSTVPYGDYYDYASSQMDKVNVTGMSPDVARKAMDKAFADGKADYMASTKFDGLRNVSSMPQQGAAFKAMGQGLNFTTKPAKVEYDSKGKKKKSLYDYK